MGPQESYRLSILATDLVLDEDFLEGLAMEVSDRVAAAVWFRKSDDSTSFVEADFKSSASGLDGLISDVETDVVRFFKKIIISARGTTAGVIHITVHRDKEPYFSKAIPAYLKNVDDYRLKRMVRALVKGAVGCVTALVLSGCGDTQSAVFDNVPPVFRPGVGDVGPQIDIDPDLYEVVLDFIDDASDRGADTEFRHQLRIVKFEKFTNVPGALKKLGLCKRFTYPSGSRRQSWAEVYISLPEDWPSEESLGDGDTDSILKYIIYHELGHCLLEQGHEEQDEHGYSPVRTEELPKIMAPTIDVSASGVAGIEGKWEGMVDHLFNQNKKG